MFKTIEALYCTQIGVSRNKMHFYAIRCKIFLQMRSRSLLDVLDDEERRDKECGIAEARNHDITASRHRSTAAPLRQASYGSQGLPPAAQPTAA
jgi:hypothetical protein